MRKQSFFIVQKGGIFMSNVERYTAYIEVMRKKVIPKQTTLKGGSVLGRLKNYKNTRRKDNGI